MTIVRIYRSVQSSPNLCVNYFSVPESLKVVLAASRVSPDEAEDAGGLTPGKDDNEVWRNPAPQIMPFLGLTEHSAWIKIVRSSRPSLQSSSIRFFSDNPIHRKDDLRLRIQQRIRKPEVSRKYLVYFADATPIYQVEGEILADSYLALEKEITKSEN